MPGGAMYPEKACPYTFVVTFKRADSAYSSITYFPSAWICKDDTSATRWAAAMREGLGADYACELQRDGKPIATDAELGRPFGERT